MASRFRRLDGPQAVTFAPPFDAASDFGWPDVEYDVTVNLLPFHRCSVCGDPARASVYDLKLRQHTLLCGTCPLPSIAKR